MYSYLKACYNVHVQAFDLTELREVAVKIHQLNSSWNEAKKASYVRHALREYSIHRGLAHARIVALLDIFEIDANTFATVLELCTGGDLDTHLKEHQARCSPPDASFEVTGVGREPIVSFQRLPIAGTSIGIMHQCDAVSCSDALPEIEKLSTPAFLKLYLVEHSLQYDAGPAAVGAIVPKRNLCMCAQVLPEKEARVITAQVVQGLAYLNEAPRHIIHYDLKPANILFDTFGQAKITVSATSIHPFLSFLPCLSSTTLARAAACMTMMEMYSGSWGPKCSEFSAKAVLQEFQSFCCGSSKNMSILCSISEFRGYKGNEGLCCAGFWAEQDSGGGAVAGHGADQPGRWHLLVPSPRVLPARLPASGHLQQGTPAPTPAFTQDSRVLASSGDS